MDALTLRARIVGPQNICGSIASPWRVVEVEFGDVDLVLRGDDIEHLVDFARVVSGVGDCFIELAYLDGRPVPDALNFYHIATFSGQEIVGLARVI